MSQFESQSFVLLKDQLEHPAKDNYYYSDCECIIIIPHMSFSIPLS